MFTKQCKLHTIRQEECRDIHTALVHLASLHADLLLERARLETALREYRQYLPDATGRLEGHTAGFKVWKHNTELYTPTLCCQEAVHATEMLHGSSLAPPGMDLTAQERSLLAWTASELERVLTAPVNQLRSKELQLRKAMLVFRDTKVAAVPAALLASWRTKLPSELKPEQREWVAMERVLHPDLYSTKLTPAVPTHWTKDKLLSLIQTPEEQISILPPKERHVRDLLWHYDNVFCLELITPKAVPVSHHAVNHTQQGMKVEVDIDLRCRLVQQELDRAMANPNDMMDSSILHSAPQRFPTQVLRLELEKELDRLLLSQLYERETAEWKALAASLDKTDDGDSSDSDPEAQIARLAKAKAAGKPQSGTKKATKPSFQKQKRAIQDTVVSSATCLTALRSGGGAVSFRKMDLFGELTMECRVWEKHLRLRAIDTELHAAYNWPGDHFETVALHGFTQMQQVRQMILGSSRPECIHGISW
ncbi:hypothetical protein DYB36_003384 [Aphanomyces astaci]|uniref:Uncharacterized protein n=3 Tax=Aphanomyces astaci TaxID=112090 RepID=A0A396ZTY2_APHAT|nr:hypothetical protein DYB36_003384 [Aphanomyces astaci]